MNEAIVVSALVSTTVIIRSLGVPLVRAFARRHAHRPIATPLSPKLSLRLDRLDAMVETVSVEGERLVEGQRFTTGPLSEGAVHPVAERAREAASMRAAQTEVTHA